MSEVRQGPTPHVRFREVSVKKEWTVYMYILILRSVYDIDHICALQIENTIPRNYEATKAVAKKLILNFVFSAVDLFKVGRPTTCPGTYVCLVYKLNRIMFM